MNTPLLWRRGARQARIVRRAIDIAAFIGAAALASYLILQPRW